MAIYHEEFVDVHFTRPFYKHMLMQDPTLDDLQDLDIEYHKQLKWILENDIDDMELDIYFSFTQNQFGQQDTIALKENGENILVQNHNKEEYINCYTKFVMTHVYIPLSLILGYRIPNASILRWTL